MQYTVGERNNTVFITCFGITEGGEFKFAHSTNYETNIHTMSSLARLMVQTGQVRSMWEAVQVLTIEALRAISMERIAIDIEPW